MSFAWVQFYGRLLNLTSMEFWATPYGELMDLISCYQVHRGMASLKSMVDDGEMIPDIP